MAKGWLLKLQKGTRDAHLKKFAVGFRNSNVV